MPQNSTKRRRARELTGLAQLLKEDPPTKGKGKGWVKAGSAHAWTESKAGSTEITVGLAGNQEGLMWQGTGQT